MSDVTHITSCAASGSFPPENAYRTASVWNCEWERFQEADITWNTAVISVSDGMTGVRLCGNVESSICE